MKKKIVCLAIALSLVLNASIIVSAGAGCGPSSPIKLGAPAPICVVTQD